MGNPTEPVNGYTFALPEGPLISIIGMHRSGTSLLAGATQVLGVDLGPDEWLVPATPDNPRGHWEDYRFVTIAEHVLATVGGWWSYPPELAPGWELDERLGTLRVWAVQTIQDRYMRRADTVIPVAFKDPRASLILPFWRTIMEVRSITGVRHPAAVVASMAKRDNMNPEWGAYLWLRYTVDSILNDPSGLCIRYEDWFSGPTTVVSLVAEHLGLPETSAERMAEVQGFFDPALHRSTGDATMGGTFMGKLAAFVYERIETGPAAKAVDACVEVSEQLADAGFARCRV